MEQKRYKAIFFDWDGTAVLNRRADPGPVIRKMIPLLDQGMYLIIISGTSYENIAGGRLEQLLPPGAWASSTWAWAGGPAITALMTAESAACWGAPAHPGGKKPDRPGGLPPP